MPVHRIVTRPWNRSSRGYRSIRDWSILARLNQLISFIITMIHRFTQLGRISIDLIERLDRFRCLIVTGQPWFQTTTFASESQSFG
jgi:hypothetical protein